MPNRAANRTNRFEPARHSRGVPPLRLLLIEDSPDYACLVREMLAGTGAEVRVSECSTICDGLSRLRQTQHDCVLMDLGLPDNVGLDGVRRIQDAVPEVPIVVLSGERDAEIGVRAVQEGAQDYLFKRGATGELVLRALRYAIERKRTEVDLAHRALHDSLTGLPNRALLNDRLQLGLSRALRSEGRLALLFLDLDRFKLVNDSLGHDVGDQLLALTAQRLAQAVRPGDTVARFGGDEFTVLCDPIDDERQALLVAERISGALVRPFTVEGHELFVAASIGIAFAGDGESDPTALIRDADRAMYESKQRGSRYRVAKRDGVDDAVARLSIRTQLHRALKRQELRLVYQPEIDLDTGEVFSVEALLRWQHPERGLLAPDRFISSAEDTGLIVPIGTWVIERACRQLAEWRAAGLCSPQMTMSVNLSLRQLAEPELIPITRRVLEAHAIEPGALCFEITEHVVVADRDDVVQNLELLRELGIGLSLDDFGVGLSALSALDRYPLDMLKIDRSFVTRLESDGERAERMFTVILGAARAVGLRAIAEGVETAAQLAIVRRLGCSAAQGFHLERPGAPETVGARLLAGATSP